MKCMWEVCRVRFLKDVQYHMYHTVPGLENARNCTCLMQSYDCIPAIQLKPTLEFKKINGLLAAVSLTAVQDMKKQPHRDYGRN